MGKNKLKKFAEMAEMPNVVECPRDVLLAEGFPLKGSWRKDFFKIDDPVVLELGCGKGEYAVGLARTNPDRLYIGIDIKGARMYTGAKQALEDKMPNVAFLRTEIQLIENFFGKDEVDEIWITFPDPQMKKVNKRLTSTRLLKSYRNILKPDGVVKLKTDSPFLFEYTRRLAELNGFEILEISSDLHNEGRDDELTRIRTAYEIQWMSRGKTIKYIAFRLRPGELKEPDVSDLEKDDYRAIPRFDAIAHSKNI